MSGSSGDEMGDDVGLQIKPPQPHRRNRIREDRFQRRWVGEHDRQRERDSGRSEGGGGIGGGGGRSVSGEPKRQYYDHRSDRGHARNQRPSDTDGSSQRRGDEFRNRNRRFNEYGTGASNSNPRRMDAEAPSTSRGQNTEIRRAEQDQHRRGDHRSKQLHKSVKQKRKHLELEEQRALREIEKRNRRERRDEQERTSGTEKRRRKHEASSHSPPHSRHASDQEDGEGQAQADAPRKSEELDDILVVEEIVHSSPEFEEENESRSHVEEHPYHSDVSSDFEMEDEMSRTAEGEGNVEKPTKSPSQASSKSANSDTSSSKSGSDSDGSSGSKSSEEEGGDENSHSKSGKNSPPDPTGDRDKADMKGSSDVEIMDVEKGGEKPPLDESLLTEVDRAIRQVNLLPPYFPAVQGCRRVEEFSVLNRIEEGTYGVVYRAKDKRTNEVVALKRLKMEKEKDGFPITSLREINTLLKAQHENIVTVREIVIGSDTDKIFLVMDYVEHDLKALMETLKQKSQMFLLQEVKCLMIQLLRAVAHLHDNWILHRDLKTSNLLLSHKGILKVGDFGLAREYGSPLKGYTPIVVTLWYRAPELLLGVKEYSTPIDVWSVGCIFGELVKMEPTFPGKSEANELNLIFQTLGTPNDRIWPGYTKLPLLQKMTFVDQPMNKLKTRFGSAIGDKGIDLMNKLLTYNPAKRITAEEALNHQFFKESPLPIDPSVFPTWPAKSELGHRKAPSSPKPPSGGRQFKDLRDDEDSSGFFLGTGAGDRRLPMGGGFSLKF